MIRVYGIRQCDTLKKALRWLDEQQIPYAYHDYRKDGLSPELLQEFIDALGWEALFNKRGTTYRQLDDATKQALDAKLAFEVMLAQPAIRITSYNVCYTKLLRSSKLRASGAPQ